MKDSEDKPDNPSILPTKQSAVPATRLSRLSKIGGLASSIAGRALASGAKDLLQAKRPSIQSTLLSTKNASSVAKRLSEMRGAAMKVGQMLSMDAGEFLPKEWEPILAALRKGADTMPKAQLLLTLKQQWGDDWAKHFSYFSFEPIASASIGQVHRARLKVASADTDDTSDKSESLLELAIKVQYPGVADSIDSDVKNVGRLIRLSAMVPKSFDLDDILAQATEQLQHEADYVQEAAYLQAYQQHIIDYEHDENDAGVEGMEDAALPRFVIPKVYAPLSNHKILCMQYVDGEPIESLLKHAPQRKSAVMSQLFRLMLDELFHFKLVQSDPNFANYLYDARSNNIALLDFGACRKLSEDTSKQYRHLASAMLEQDVKAIEHAMRALRLIHDSMSKEVISAILNASLIASECLQTNTYNFKQAALIQRIYDATKILMNQKQSLESPVFDVALVNRKVSGMVLLANKMHCEIPLRRILIDALALNKAS